MFDTFPTLHTDRLDLVEIKQEHLNDIFKLFSDSRVTQFYNIVTLTKGHSNIIGTIGFNNFTKRHRANIGYDLQFDF
jgi:ribosomal-protein-alanine N-acetyltransferase